MIRPTKFSNRGGDPRGDPGTTCEVGGQRGEPEAISQPVDPGGVGRFGAYYSSYSPFLDHLSLLCRPAGFGTLGR